MSIHRPEDPKIVTFAQAKELIRRAKAKNLTTVLAKGVFDVIHIGHSTFLKEAKRAGDLLFVGLEPDESVKMNKGSARPFNPLEERLQLMADLQAVDFVFSFEDAPLYGAAGAHSHNQRMRDLLPDKVALSLGDPFFQLRSENALKIGVTPVAVTGIWREYSSTKLLASLGRE